MEEKCCLAVFLKLCEQDDADRIGVLLLSSSHPFVCVCVSVYCVLMMSSFVPLFKWRSAAAAADCVCPRFLLLLSKMKFCLASQLVSPLVAFPSATTAGDWNVIAELWCFSLFPGKRRRNTHTNSRYSPFLLFLPSSSCCFSGCLYTN